MKPDSTKARVGVVCALLAAATLRQLRSAALSFDLPVLTDSQAAVRAARAVRARR